jgi:hypothetical protein
MAGEIIDNPDTGNGDQPGDNVEAGDELPVKIDTLSLDGTQPEVGDEVEVKVKGKVTRIRDDCAYVAIETANDNPIENPPDQPQDDMSEQGMMDMAAKADQNGQGLGAYG